MLHSCLEGRDQRVGRQTSPIITTSRNPPEALHTPRRISSASSLAMCQRLDGLSQQGGNEPPRMTRQLQHILRSSKNPQLIFNLKIRPINHGAWKQSWELGSQSCISCSSAPFQQYASVTPTMNQSKTEVLPRV